MRVFYCLVCLASLGSVCLADQLNGVVKSKSGEPLKGVQIYSRADNQLGSVENFLTSTDEKGQFHLRSHGVVVYFRLLSFQPLIKILKGNTNYIDVVLEESQATEWTIPQCSNNNDSNTYIGVGFSLPVPSTAFIEKGKEDHGSSTTFYYQGQHGKETLTYYWSWMALGFPREELILASVEYSVRPFRSGRYGGIDVQGRFKNGGYWRFIGDSSGVEISYENVLGDAAGYFNKIIGGMCLRD